jgi:hypothetical protein
VWIYDGERSTGPIAVPEGPLQPTADDWAAQCATGLDQPTLPRLQVCGSV